MSPNVSGRITYLQVHEGDHIAHGQVLVRIDPSEVQAQVRQAQGAVTEAQHRLAQAQVTQAATNAQVQTALQQQRAAVLSAQADLNQAERTFQTQVAAAEAAITNAQATVNTDQANLRNAQAHYAREQQLFEGGFVSAQDAEDARTAMQVAETTLAGAQAQLQSARQQSATTRATGAALIADNRAKLEQARQSVIFAQANLTQQPAYVQNLKALRAAVVQAQENVAATVARLSYTTLKAPLEGVVTARLQDPGSEATPGQPILVVQYFRDIWVSVTVTGDVAGRIAVGCPATVALDAFPGRTCVGRIIQFNPSADLTSRQFTVRVALPNPGLTLLPGMFAHVTIVTGREPGAIVVPREAVQHDARGDFVMVINRANLAHRRRVFLGQSAVSVIQITSGVYPGEEVVDSHAATVKGR